MSPAWRHRGGGIVGNSCAADVRGGEGRGLHDEPAFLAHGGVVVVRPAHPIELSAPCPTTPQIHLHFDESHVFIDEPAFVPAREGRKLTANEAREEETVPANGQ